MLRCFSGDLMTIYSSNSYRLNPREIIWLHSSSYLVLNVLNINELMLFKLSLMHCFHYYSILCKLTLDEFHIYSSAFKYHSIDVVVCIRWHWVISSQIKITRINTRYFKKGNGRMKKQWLNISTICYKSQDSNQ